MISFYLNGEDADVPVGENVVDVEELEWCPGGLEHQDQKQGDDRKPQVIAPNHNPRARGINLFVTMLLIGPLHKSLLLIGRERGQFCFRFSSFTTKKYFGLLLFLAIPLKIY
jgi:hypothetical protein